MTSNIRAWDTIEAGVEGLPIEVPNDPGNWYLTAALKIETENRGFLLLNGHVSEMTSGDSKFSIRAYCTQVALLATPTLFTTPLVGGDWKSVTSSNVLVAKSASNNLVNMAILNANAVHLDSIIERGHSKSSSVGVHENVDWTQEDYVCLLLVSPLESAIQKYHCTVQWLEEG